MAGAVRSKNCVQSHRYAIIYVVAYSVLQNLNINTETHMSIIGLSEVINVTAELGEVEVRKVPFGPFAATLNRLVVPAKPGVSGFGYR